MIRRLCFASALALGACSGSLFESKATPPAVYVLRPAVAEAAAPPIAAQLTIDKPQLRPGLDSSRIAVEYPDRRMDYFANANWSGDAGELLQNLIVQSFQRGAGLAAVTADSSRFEGAYRLELTVNDFAAHYSSAGGPPTVRIEISARLGHEGRALPGSEQLIQVEHPAATNRLSAVIAAYESAAQEAIAALIASTRQQIGAQAAPPAEAH